MADNNNNDEPAAKKKRGADRQITKDDDPEGDEGGQDDTADGSFRKADSSVMAGRRVVKARRPMASVAEATEAVAAKPSSNPFANTTLVADSSDSNKPKAFGAGSGFGGFGSATTAASSSSTGVGGFGSGSSGGFGSAGTQFKGFATAPATTTTGGFGSSGGFGSASATATTADGVTTKNLFDTSKTSVPSFGFGAAKPSEDDSNNNDKTKTAGGESASSDAPATNTSNNFSTVQLPESDAVVVTTGEEGETVLFEERAKSFLRVMVDPKADDTEQTKTTQQAAAPCVAPSSASTFAKKEDSDADAAAGSPAKQKQDGEESESAAAVVAVVNDEDTNNAAAAKTAAATTEKRWKDVGVGPLKLLKGSKPGAYRIVQRYQGKNPGDKPTRVLVNEVLYREATMLKQGEKYMQLTLPPNGTIYSFKFTKEERALDFYNCLTSHKAKAKLLFDDDDVKDNATAKKKEVKA